jgi:hypothetical protein
LREPCCFLSAVHRSKVRQEATGLASSLTVQRPSFRRRISLHLDAQTPLSNPRNLPASNWRQGTYSVKEAQETRCETTHCRKTRRTVSGCWLPWLCQHTDRDLFAFRPQKFMFHITYPGYHQRKFGYCRTFTDPSLSAWWNGHASGA